MNLSCDHFKQLCLSKGKRVPVVLLPHEAKQALATTLFRMPWLQLPTTISLREILTRNVQFFFTIVAQVVLVHNSHMLSSGDV